MDYDKLPDIDPWKMFVGAILPNWLLVRSPRELSFGAKCLYARLLQFKGRTGACFPKTQTLAEEIGVSCRQTERLIQELETVKLIRVDRSGNPKGKPSVYSFRPHLWIDEALGIAREVPQDSSGGPPTDSSGGPPTDSSGGPPTDSPGQLRESYEENHMEENQRLTTSSGQGVASLHLGPPPLATKQEEGFLDVRKEPSSIEKSADIKTRLARARAGEKAAAAKAAKQVAANFRKSTDRQLLKREKADQALQNLRGDGTGSIPYEVRDQVRQIERLVRAELSRSFPDMAVVDGGAKERGQILELLKATRSTVATENAVKYLVRNWQTLKDRYLRGKGGYPSLGFLVKLRSSLLPEADLWSRHVAVLEEWDRIPDDCTDVPSDLLQRYQTAKRELEQLGL